MSERSGERLVSASEMPSSTEQRFILEDVIRHHERLLTGELFHQIVRSGKDPIETFFSDAAHMLLEVCSVASLLQKFLERLNVQRDISDLSFQNSREDVGNFILTQLLWTVEGVRLSGMFAWVIENCGNDPAQIFTCNRRVANVAEGERKDTFLLNDRREILEPLRKQCGPQMSNRNS